jgi:hypothetical protein
MRLFAFVFLLFFFQVSDSNAATKSCVCSIKFETHNKSGNPTKVTLDLNGKDLVVKFNIPTEKSCKNHCYDTFSQTPPDPTVANAKNEHAKGLRAQGMCGGWISGSLYYDGVLNGVSGGSGLWAEGIGGDVTVLDDGYEYKRYCSGTPENYVYEHKFYDVRCNLNLADPTKAGQTILLDGVKIERKGKDYCKTLFPMNANTFQKYNDKIPEGKQEMVLVYRKQLAGSSAITADIVEKATYLRVVNKCQLILVGQPNKVLTEVVIQNQDKGYCNTVIPMVNSTFEKYLNQMLPGSNTLNLYYNNSNPGQSGVVQTATYTKKVPSTSPTINTSANRSN